MANREVVGLQHEGILHTEGVWEEQDIRRLQNFGGLARSERRELVNNLFSGDDEWCVRMRAALFLPDAQFRELVASIPQAPQKSDQTA